jgi:voltage-gated potassium channel
VISKIRTRAHRALDVAQSDHGISVVVDRALVALIVLNVVAVVFESVDSMRAQYEDYFYWFEVVSVAIFTAEYLARVWSCVESIEGRFKHPLWGRIRYMLTPLAIIDLVVVLPFYLSVFVGIDLRFLRVLRLLRIFKLTRYSGAWETFTAVLSAQRRTFIMVAFLMVVMLMLSASVMYLIEQDAQPDAFANIPSAMWWALVTLTTVGYGDVTPVTDLGKIIGGFVTILGLGMYALPAAILASGFMQELGKRQFVVTWNLVAKVPFFAKLDATEIAEIVELLQPYTVPPRYTIIRRGEPATCMYFITAGDVEVEIPPHPFHLSSGDFFGELALLQRGPRVATVVSITECQLLILESRDLDRLLDEHPDMAADLRAVARARVAEAMHLDTEQLPDWLAAGDVDVPDPRDAAGTTVAPGDDQPGS